MSNDKALDALSAIWILSANDENPLITYRGLVSRIGLTNEDEIRSLVEGRRDLFRLRVLPSRLREWKKEMAQGRSLPVWISEISPECRGAEIEKLTVDDVFRNQFRIKDGAPKCDLETIDWGLQYIERMRAAKAQNRQESRTLWSTRLSILSVFVTVATLAGTTWFQNNSIELQTAALQSQERLKQYEVSFRPKQEGYSALISTMGDATIMASVSATRPESRDPAAFGALAAKLASQLLALAPFLTENEFQELAVLQQQFVEHYAAALSNGAVGSANADEAKKIYQLISSNAGSTALRLRQILFYPP